MFFVDLPITLSTGKGSDKLPTTPMSSEDFSANLNTFIAKAVKDDEDRREAGESVVSAHHKQRGQVSRRAAKWPEKCGEFARA